MCDYKCVYGIGALFFGASGKWLFKYVIFVDNYCYDYEDFVSYSCPGTFVPHSHSSARTQFIDGQYTTRGMWAGNGHK